MNYFIYKSTIKQYFCKKNDIICDIIIKHFNIKMENTLNKSQIKSKLRVKELAEVYTNEREVNAMLDLVKDYSYDIEKRFFEPACGNGNFLVKIIERKMKTVRDLYRNSPQDTFEYQSLLALSSIYGIDICPENVRQSKARMYWKVLEAFWQERNTEFPSQNFEKNIKYILNKNIICGNTLEEKDDQGNEIVFVEFSKGKKKNTFIQRRFLFSELYKENPKPKRNNTYEKEYSRLGVR